MGIFDTYGNSQLKAGKPWQNEFNVGDKVELPDGIYCGTDSFIVVKDGVFIAEVALMFDYFGDTTLDSSDADLAITAFGKGKAK